MEHFKNAWETVKQDLVPWIILYVVFSVVMSATGGLGLILLPNVFRVTRKSLAGGVAPEIGDLFNFDFLTDDLVGMLLKSIADMIGAMFCGIGAIATGVLFFWVPLLATENRYDGPGLMKASMAHAKGSFGDIFVFMLIAMVVNCLGLLVCCIGIFVTVPVTLVATVLFYEANRDAILAAADAAGVEVKA